MVEPSDYSGTLWTNLSSKHIAMHTQVYLQLCFAQLVNVVNLVGTISGILLES